MNRSIMRKANIVCPVDRAHRIRYDYSTGMITCYTCEEDKLIDLYFRIFAYIRCPYCGNTELKDRVVTVNRETIEFQCECSEWFNLRVDMPIDEVDL